MLIDTSWVRDAGSLLRRPPADRLTIALLAVALTIGCASSGGNVAEQTPPPSPAGTAVASQPPQAVMASCYDCHSSRGGAVWNARLAPSYWFSGAAQKDLNFSDWRSLDTQRRSKDLEAIATTVREGSMPPWDYTLLHPSAKLTGAEKAVILDWTAKEIAAAPQ